MVNGIKLFIYTRIPHVPGSKCLTSVLHLVSVFLNFSMGGGGGALFRVCFPFPFPLSYYIILSVRWVPVFSPFCMGAHSWVARICQAFCNFFCNFYCVVPENIHTPTTEGIGNSEGEGGGGQRPRKFQWEGGLYDRFSFQRSFDSI